MTWPFFVRSQKRRSANDHVGWSGTWSRALWDSDCAWRVGSAEPAHVVSAKLLSVTGCV